jgi:hypothetical protein
MTQDNLYFINEGSVVLPDSFLDRTTNIFIRHEPGQPQLNFNIARDTVKEKETIQDYVSRQIGLLKQNMAGYKLQNRTEATLGKGDEAVTGEQIEATYKSGGQTIYQRQAAFLISPGWALIFSASSAKVFDEYLHALWKDWLVSFQRRVDDASTPEKTEE